ncbi:MULTISPECIES: hypothetical protein [unclassified Tolypothrix]|uniref:hypothetical protein n=1 Tax=unclassified Tolypothrix TaxID=2649714 RepID=UPI0005EAC098|nr:MULTISPECIES: hypothetical protein [unclassified Tolypothrix]BAY90746.1 hypothetical protein NIES3275_27630 [Microchaete diplosiphon NIES-3275]EKF04421.1 hypothetical protein FDUTEX481_02101 [Tolypothrix sp. PCC 7601]MBE9081052.1 hypothetical protein [Tolypothrix sp. LEGE 11397]UYD24883.1 hypothetical protein HGR01_26210 [Tolypothrix sp. PCC 7712]UYD32885.1 hypothetical protein HG267_28425 [Tolypothrix sp. PCC 7601]
MKKTLLIATTLMALALPAHATQINQYAQDNQDKMSLKAQPEGTTSLCYIYRNKLVCTR